MPAKIKNGSIVEQIVTPIKGVVTRKELVGDDILVFVLNDADGHEYPLHEDNVKVLKEPSNDEPVAETPAADAAPTGETPAA